ncbi:translation factor [Paenibacillus glacialis]|uniref:Threonylcarbamoyl-AMP synthase n=2 Tax=Paenibacillus glacialis TaxID=494026 RepID=A0A162KAQ5_9BACL|nr:translation factor [Paenibacillus glacialis]
MGNETEWKRVTTAYWNVQSLSEEGEGTAKQDVATKQAMKEASELLQKGGIVAFPTETVYGLGADARSTAAVEAVFAAKGRPADNPLIVHIAERSQLEELVTEIPAVALTLMDVYWPGPLTIVLPLRPNVLSPRVTAGLDTVGIRMPDHPVALALIAASGCPIAAPSANRSGRPSPTLASHVQEDLVGRIDGVLDGGPAGVGLESTVVRVFSNGQIQVLRPGGITIEQLSATTGATVISTGGADEEAQSAISPGLQAVRTHVNTVDSEAPRSPGVKYTHYAPQGELNIVRGSSAQVVATKIKFLLDKAAHEGAVTGLLAFDEHIPFYGLNPASVVISLGSLVNPAETAHKLYASLRLFDEMAVDYILSEACPEEGLGEAIMNRLIKAAGGRIIDIG